MDIAVKIIPNCEIRKYEGDNFFRQLSMPYKRTIKHEVFLIGSGPVPKMADPDSDRVFAEKLVAQAEGVWVKML